MQRCSRAVAKTNTHQDYVERFEQRNVLFKNVKRMQSFSHIIYNVEQKKVALSCLDNKRAWVDENNSLPYGHHKLLN